MALYNPPEGSKLIFAPAGTQPHGQAPQFTLSTLTLSDLDQTSPIPQFHRWFSQAQSTSYTSLPGSPQPEACTLSTAELPSGRVSSRVVYLKELDARGFVIYTNLGTSRKAADLATNPHASLVFYWPGLQRQVRVEGTTERNEKAESQRYFDTRVRGSRIGAWASKQSQVLQPKSSSSASASSSSSTCSSAIPTPVAAAAAAAAGNAGEDVVVDDGRAQLEEWVQETEQRFKGQDEIPVPDFWGGLRIIPQRVEFWQGRESRLHDRFVYEWEDDKEEAEGQGKGKGKEGKWRLERLSP